LTPVKARIVAKPFIASVKDENIGLRETLSIRFKLRNELR
jgi:hypothetical protein